ncbi:MAG: transglutaminase-like domain-containing protein [Eubacterium sp.]|nr:transglutaminase-like domain-containing protein [Eubacterium sp.]
MLQLKRQPREKKRSGRQKEPCQVIANGLVMRDGATFDTEPRYKTLLLKGFIVYLVVMGSMGCLLSSFKIPYDALVIHLAVLVGSLFSAFLYYTKVWENLGYFILFAIMLGTALMLRRYISSGFFAVVNIISERAAYHFDTEVVQGYAEAVGNRDVTVTIAMVYVGWVHAILLNALISRQMKYFAVMFASFFFLTVPFYLECEPDMLYILMLMAGCLIVFVFRGARHTPIKKDDQRFEYQKKKRHINYVYAARHHMVIVGILIAVVMVFGGVFQMFVSKTDYELEGTRGRSEWKASTENTMANLYKNGLWGLFNRYDSTGGLKSGVLGGVNSVTLDYETDLEVTYVPHSSDRMYLRTFTGADYLPFDNRWQRSEKYLVVSRPDQDLLRSEQRTQIEGVRINEATTDATARKLRERYEKGEQGTAKARMEIKNVAAGLGTFLPYYVDERVSEEFQLMGYRQTVGVTYFPWLADPGRLKSQPEGKKTLADQVDDGSLTGNRRLLLERGRYNAVPEANREVIDAFIRDAGLEGYRAETAAGGAGTSDGKGATDDAKSDAKAAETANDEKAVQLLRALGDYFQENIPYTYQPGVTPRDEDFINYFLADNKRGYCAHFASAATLILRRLGYQARYVEGYAIDPTNLTEDGRVRNDLLVKDYYDGDNLLNGQSKVVTVNVTDAMAHAWVEVKIGGHWRIAELTPWSTEEPPGEGFFERLIDFFSGTSSGGGAGDTSAGGVGDGGAGLDSIGRVLGYAFLIVFGVAAVVVLIVLMTRVIAGRVRYVRADRSDRLVIEFHRRTRRADRKAAQRAEAHVSTRQTEAPLGGRPSTQLPVSINYRERVQAMEQAGKLSLTSEEREELIRILERAGFSGREISVEEYEKARNLIR